MARKIDTDANITRIRFVQQTSHPSSPSSGYDYLYIISGSAHGGLYLEDSSGKQIGPFITGSPATAGGYSQGTSFPVSPSNDDKYYRTDRNLLYYYVTGTWLTTEQFQVPLYHPADINTGISANLTAGGLVPDSVYGMYLERLECSIYVATTNNGSNYWTIGLSRRNSADTLTSIITMNTSADSVNTGLKKSVNINANLDSSAIALQVVLTKTSAPGTAYYFSPLLVYRLIG